MTEEKKVDRLYVDRRDLDDFNRLKEKDSPFAGSQNKDVFLAAMVTGYHEGGRVPLKTREGYFMRSYLKDPELALIRAIAIAEENSLNVLLDEQKVFSIAEEYAAGGIQLLKAKVFGEGYGSYSKKLEGELLRTLEKTISTLPKRQTLEEVAELSISDLIKSGESNSVEFKASLIWDYENKKPDKSLLGMVAARTISCFMNSDGGIILIGVADNKKILGLEKDLAELEGSTDSFELHLTNVINKYLGKIKGTLVNVKFHTLEDKQVAALIIKKSPRPVYIKCEGKKEFYIRSSNSCQPLDVSEVPEYIKDHWPNLL
jgi:hypothetical protein